MLLREETIGDHPSYPKFKSNLECLIGILQGLERDVGVTEKLRVLYRNI